MSRQPAPSAWQTAATYFPIGLRPDDEVILPPMSGSLSDNPILAELERILASSDWLGEENRQIMTEELGNVRSVFAAMAAKRRLPVAEAAQMQEELREAWMDLLQKCREEEDADEAILQAKANQAEARSNLVMDLLRIAHANRKMFDSGKFDGTPEQREILMQQVHEIEACKDDCLKELPAGDIQKLRDEGVI
jgi:hypothetical protein